MPLLKRLLKPLRNNRGQLNLANTLGLASPILNSLTGNRTRQPSTGGGFLGFDPQQLLGAGLLGGSLFADDQPAEVKETQQFLRNLATQGSSFAGELTSSLGGLTQEFEPLFNQQSNRLLDQVQQRVSAGQPANLVGVQGPEVRGLRDVATNEILPAQRAFLADLALKSMGIRTNAAGMLLQSAQPNPLGDLLSALGLSLLSGQGGGGGGFLGGGAGGQAGGQQAGQQGGALQNALGAILGQGGDAGQFAPIGQLDAAGIIGQMQAGTLSTAEGLSLLARTALPGALATGAGGFFGGQAIGEQFPNQATGTLGGGLAGALGGAVAGSTIFPGLGTVAGAVIGALSGGAGGFFGQRAASHEQKEANRQADINSQASQTRAAFDFLGGQLDQFGFNADEPLGLSGDGISPSMSLMDIGSKLISTTEAPGSQQEQVSAVLGPILLDQYRQVDPSINSLDQVPGLRSSFLDFLSANAWVEPSAGQQEPFTASSASTTLNEILGGAGFATLARGGFMPFGGPALVGEAGEPELVLAGPGTMVIPLTHSRN